jgi:hypothetical protein
MKILGDVVPDDNAHHLLTILLHSLTQALQVLIIMVMFGDVAPEVNVQLLTDALQDIHCMLMIMFGDVDPDDNVQCLLLTLLLHIFTQPLQVLMIIFGDVVPDNNVPSAPLLTLLLYLLAQGLQVLIIMIIFGDVSPDDNIPSTPSSLSCSTSSQRVCKCY